jgi:rare lipoprotein A (peptidoglycan hydrolase)
VTGRTVDEVLKELSVVSRGALIAPAPSTQVGPGDEIVVAQSVGATVVYDGKTQPVRTNVLTAGGLLRQLGVVLGPYDRVEPSILAYPSEGSTIKVVRVNQAVEKLHSKIPFKRQTEQDSNLELGIRKVRSRGVEGIRESSYRIVYEDGKVKSRSFLGAKVLKEPVPEVTLVGSYRPTLTTVKHNQAGRASWYHQPGLMAAHRTLPFGTKVRVTNVATGKQVTVTIRDRGPYIDGRIIDLSDTAFNQLSPQSRGVLNVKIEW